MHNKFLGTVAKLSKAATRDVKVGTKIEGIHTHVLKLYKKDEFGKLIGLDVPDSAEKEIQTDQSVEV